VKIDQHITALDHDGRSLAAAAGHSGLAAPVPSCPPWRVRDLLRHLRYVHWWAATHVREGRDGLMAGPSEAELLHGGPPDDELLDAYRDGHRALVETLSSADPAIACATFLPAPSPLAFWARRQAHETAIHRADAELAATGTVTAFDPEFAADGVDELVMGFAPRDRPATGASPAIALGLRATDTGDAWHAGIGADGVHAHRGEGHADAVMSGPASGLYLLLWNRQDPGASGVTVSGQPGALRRWREAVHVRWA
jgi:uncharacterized protein (TIGR03083 family)